MAKNKTDKPQDDLRRRIKELDAYLSRVGAEELNFRRYMVRDYRGGRGYYVERTLIKILQDGDIWCSRKEHGPTEGEAKAIKEAFVKIDVPKSIGVPIKEAEAYAEKIKNPTYLFIDRREGKVTFIQERWQKPDGSKVYIPHSPWSDGSWRKMEADGDLPFWKPLEDRQTGRKMIHEGAKAASHIDALVNDKTKAKDLAAHPWGETLRLYEHWGMIGGALAPHRSDYGELTREKPTEVVYVSDNDYAGEAALQVISRCYGDSLAGIKFGAEFPQSWDMADAIPLKLFSGEGKLRRYTGGPLEDMMKPATWATEIVPNPTGKGRSTTIMRRPFLEEWVHSVRPEVFIHRDWPYEMWTAGEFNSVVRPYSNVDDTARLVKTDDASKAAVIRYDPSRPPGIYMDKAAYINTHMPTDVKREKGDPGPWLEFLEHLVPEETDRIELMRWCATLISRPDIKMSYGALLISETQGVGKGTLGEKILAPLVGRFNVSYPSENEICESNYNYWLAHKRLAVVHEIYSGHSTKAYNKLKSVITDRYTTVSKKFIANYEIECWIHILAMSNSYRAIKMSMDDRRWYLPKVTDQKKPVGYWTRLNEWLTNQGGLGIIRQWSDDWLRKNDVVMPGAEAPWSTIKREVVEEGYSPGMLLVTNTLGRVTSILDGKASEDETLRERWKSDGMLGPNNEVAILDLQLVELIHETIYSGRQNDRLEKAATLRKLSKSIGWHIGTSKVSTGMREWGPKAHNGMIISNSQEVAGTPPAILGGRTGERKEAILRLRPLNLDFARGL